MLALVALFVFGPERLPSMARQAGKALRDLRGMIGGIRKDLSEELRLDENDLNLRELDPRSYVRMNVLEGLDLVGGAETRKADRRGRTGEPSAPSSGGEPAETPTYDPDAT